MATGTFSGLITIGSVQMQANVSRTKTGAEGHEPAMAAGVAGTLTTRTGDDEGTLTLAEEHGFITGDILAVFWKDAGVPKVMYGFAATVSGTSVAIAPSGTNYSGASPTGSVLPAEDTEVVVSKKVTVNVSLESDDVQMIGVGCDQPAIGILGGAAAIYVAHVAVAYSPLFWDKASGAACPIDSDPTTLVCYNGGVVPATFQFGVLLQPA